MEAVSAYWKRETIAAAAWEFMQMRRRRRERKCLKTLTRIQYPLYARGRRNDEFLHFRPAIDDFSHLGGARGQRLGHASSARCARDVQSPLAAAYRRLMNDAGQIDFPPLRCDRQWRCRNHAKCESCNPRAEFRIDSWRVEFKFKTMRLMNVQLETSITLSVEGRYKVVRSCLEWVNNGSN